MKKTATTLLLSFCFLTSTATTLWASAPIGQKIFKKKLRKSCGFTGAHFTKQHTKAEWKEIYGAKQFPSETKNICPQLKLETIKPVWWKHLYDFSLEYAKDGAIPKC
jgi:hypothetical protein